MCVRLPSSVRKRFQRTTSGVKCFSTIISSEMEKRTRSTGTRQPGSVGEKKTAARIRTATKRTGHDEWDPYGGKKSNITIALATRFRSDPCRVPTLAAVVSLSTFRGWEYFVNSLTKIFSVDQHAPRRLVVVITKTGRGAVITFFDSFSRRRRRRNRYDIMHFIREPDGFRSCIIL